MRKVKKHYANEREGQIEFFDNYGVPYNDDASILVDNTDGVYNGNILEFKLNINNLSKVLFQAIKYLSRMRVKGESVPATILLVDLNATTVYVYKSEDYFDEIHTIYTGAASKDNEGFVAGPYDQKLDYSEMVDSALVKKLLKGAKADPEEMYMPINIDENCIVGWAERYYRELPNASKGDFLGDDTGTAVKIKGEIREPRHFKGIINPYTGATNEKFKYLMDCLNDKLSKKDLGAFYTPMAYAKKAAELVKMAVDRVPEGNDYIILDRCAGTGNLEVGLFGLTDRNGDELISHCVVSTYEYYEYKVLQERIGDKVRDIIPPTEANVVYENGKVANADAMSKEFIDNPIIAQYVNNPTCTIILYENPPYNDNTSMTLKDDTEEIGRTHKGQTIGSYVNGEYRKHAGELNEGKASAREIANLFIWSGFHFYLRDDYDAYVVFSPVKYFKNIGLAPYKFLEGYLFNRLHFHATPSSISCVLWANTSDNKTETFKLKAFDINGGDVTHVKDIVVKKAHSTMVALYDKINPSVDIEENKVWCQRDGTPSRSKLIDTKSFYNSNIICYLGAKAFGIDVKNRYLVRCQLDHHGCVAPVRKSDYLTKIPLWVSKMYPQDNWYEKDVYNTTSDGGDAYAKDRQFLKSCLIYTCLSNQNKCLSFHGSDGRDYQNELCFDDSRNSMPLALKDLKDFAGNKVTRLDDDEKALIGLWTKIMEEARHTSNYDPQWNYGVYQITKELNTYHDSGTGKSKKRVYDYPELNGYLDSLRTMLKAYYKSHITGKMFEYELLK